jgi:hypothetical protein
MTATVYQFGKTKAGRTKKVKPQKNFTYKVKEAEENLPTELQGKQVQSKEEARAGVALEIIELNYTYQYSIFGGHNLRGGQVVDFMLWTNPLPTPLYIQGGYWHRNRADEKFKIAKAKTLFGGRVNDPIELWDHELQSIDDAVKILREKVGGV